MFSSWKNSRFYIWILLNVDVKFPLHIMLVYVNCGHFQWKLSLASQPPWSPSPPPLSPSRTSSPRCSQAPCRSSCTWTVDMCGIFWQPLLHRWPNLSVWQGKTETEIFNPSAWIFSKEEGLVCLFWFSYQKYDWLQVSLPGDFVSAKLRDHGVSSYAFNLCTYYRQLLYISTSTFLHINQNHSFIFQPLHDVSIPALIWSPFALHTELSTSSHTPKVFSTIRALYLKYFEYLKKYILLTTFAVDLWINLFPSTVTMELKRVVCLFYLWRG